MSDSTSSSQPATTSQAANVQATSGAGSTQANAAAFAQANASTKVSSMADLEKKAPELAEAMKEGIAFRMIGSMKRHNDRLKQLMREQRNG